MSLAPVGDESSSRVRDALTLGQRELLLKMEALLGRQHVKQALEEGLESVQQRLADFGKYEAALLGHIEGKMKPSVPTVIQSPESSLKPTPMKIKVSPFSGVEGENLTFWFREVELALSAALIRNERSKVTFAISNMQGRAKSWALTWETNHPGYFRTWDALKQGMEVTFQPPNAAFRQRTKFLSCVQGKRELYEYVQELRQLRASIASSPLPEEVMVTVFLNGLAQGPVRLEVHRKEPQTLEEAIAVAQREDYCLRQARGLPLAPSNMASPAAACGPEPMDLSAVEQRRPAVQCYGCGRFGHYQRNCPRNQRGGRAPRGGRGRRGGRGGYTQPRREASGMAGNANSQ